MNFRTTLILLVLFACVGVALLFTRQSGTSGVAETKSQGGEKLVDLSQPTVSRLTITASGEKPIALERDGTNWKILEPISARADSTVVTQLVDELLALQSRGKLDAEQAHSAGTGLDHPHFVVELGTAENKTIKIDVGERTASGDNLYVRRDGESGAEIVPGSILDALDRPVSALRSRQLFDVSPTLVQQLSIVNGTSTLTMSRDSTSKWHITSPVQMDGDTSEISDLAIALTNLSATDFVEEKVDDPKRRKLDAPQLEASFSTQRPSTAPSTQQADNAVHWVKFGAFSDATKSAVYASSSDSPALVTIAESAMRALRKSPLDLRDRNLVSIDPKEVRKIFLTIDRPATTQPTTQPALHREIAIERAPTDAKTQAATAPSSQPSTNPSTSPTTMPVRKWIVLSDETVGTLDDRAIDSLVELWHPLHVDRYVASPPATPPSQKIILVMETMAAGSTNARTYSFDLSSPIGGGVGHGVYNGVAFEPPRTLLDAIEQMIQPRDRSHESPPEMPDESSLPPTRK